MKMIRIGRDAENDVVLNDAAVSRKHAEIFLDDDGNIFLTDLNSTSGTYVNGKKIAESVFLVSGDIVKLGEAQLDWEKHTSGLKQANLDKTRGFTSPKSAPKKAPAAQDNFMRSAIISMGAVIALFLVMYFANEGGAGEDSDLKKSEVLKKKDLPKTDVTRDEEGQKAEAPVPPAEGERRRKEIEQQPTQPNEEPVIVVVEEPAGSEIVYDFSCLKDENDMGTGSILDIIRGFEKETIEDSGIEVTLEEELEVGQSIKDEMFKTATIIESGSVVARIQRIFNKLVQNIPNPYGMTYEIYVVDDNVLNAFTAGGQVFIYTGIIDFCKNDDEIAAILGHEIGHNQLGHIRQHIQKNKWFEQTFGNNEIGMGAQMLESIVTTSFNQENESHCDLWGSDLCMKCGWDPCVGIGLWERMHDADGNPEYDPLDNIFRSHPYSNKRAVCIRNHMLSNYKYNCPE